MNRKKLLAFLAAVVVCCLVPVLVVNTSKAFATIEDDGYVVPLSAKLAQTLSEKGGKPIQLVQTVSNDIIYQSSEGFYLGNEMIKVDLSFPLYLKGGTSLRFMDEENWLITKEGLLYRSFEGMYLSNGTTFNFDMSQADDAEFIFVALTNNMYINACQAQITTAFDDVTITVNSIINLQKDSISWYAFKNGTMAYFSVDISPESTIKIGNYTYDYLKLLEGLGLIRNAIDDPTPVHPIDPVNPPINPIEDNPTHSGEGGQGEGTGEGQGEGQGSGEGQGEGTGTGTGEHSEGTGGGEGQGEGGQGEGTGGGEGQGEGKHTTGEGGSETGGGSGEGTGEGQGEGQGSGEGQGEGSGTTGEGQGGQGEGTGEGTGKQGEGGTGEEETGGGEGQGGTPSEPTDPGSGYNPGQGDNINPDPEHSDNPNPNPGRVNPKPTEYVEPIVRLQNITPWCYALNLYLNVYDPYDTLFRSISISVFKQVNGSGSTSTNEQGFTVYPASSYSGKSLWLRKSKKGSAEFAISPMQPGLVVYLQVSYDYVEEYYVDGIDEVTGEPCKIKMQVGRKYESDLIKVELPTISECDVHSVGVSCDTELAASSSGVTLNNFKVFNTSTVIQNGQIVDNGVIYNADAEGYRFSNFVLNTLDFITYLQLQLEQIDSDGNVIEGKSAKVTISKTVISKAKTELGTTFSSTSPKLASNKRYRYTIVAKDRWNNTIPLVCNGVIDYTDTFYTCKTQPKVEITEINSSSLEYAVRLTLTDLDNAIISGSKIKFAVYDNQTNTPSFLQGTWSNNVHADPEDDSVLYLDNTDNVFEISLTSLAYLHSYRINVSGDYDPTPDLMQDKMPICQDVSFGNKTITTASLKNCNITFSHEVTNLQDTSAMLKFTMEPTNTSLEILPSITEFRVTLLKGNEVVNVTHIYKDQAQALTNYNTNNASFLLDEGSYLSPTVTMYGAQNRVYQGNPWDSFLIRQVDVVDEQTQEITTGFNNPMELRIQFPVVEKGQVSDYAGMLTQFTGYTYYIQAIITKDRGYEYPVTVTMNPRQNDFTTLKTLPKVDLGDVLLVGGTARFDGIRVVDTGATILDKVVVVRLYAGTQLLFTKQLTADWTGEAPGTLLVFDNLVSGSSYILRFYASQYNDTASDGTRKGNYKFFETTFVAGSTFVGTLSLESLDIIVGTAQIDYTVTDKNGYLGLDDGCTDATIVVERSLSMYEQEYELFSETKIALTRDENGSYSATGTFNLDGLTKDDAWRVSMYVTYQQQNVLLTQVRFLTNQSIDIVHSHAELIAAQKKNRDANILVACDFVQDQNTYVSFRGTIDFQGHVVTRGDNITTYFLDFNSAIGEVKNLVYDFPQKVSYTNTAPIFATIANVDGFIVRTYGTVQVTSQSTPLLAKGVQTGATVQNFIVQLGGDLVVTTSDNTGAWALVNSGHALSTFRDGYIYFAPNCGVVYRSVSNGALFYPTCCFENIFVIADSWYQNANSELFVAVGGQRWKNCYTVGDFYQINAGENKSYYLPSDTVRTTESSLSASAVENIWALTAREYKDIPAVKRGKMAKLRDVTWQASVLGSAFDIDGTVPMGFYPRLNLNECLAPYQDYISLPILDENVAPVIVSDNWATGDVYGNHTLTSGYIRFSLHNDSNCKVLGITINGLLTNVVEQYYNNEGLYDVIVFVQVNPDPQMAQYVDSYEVTDISYQYGTRTETATSSYKTSGFEFWKEVGSYADWSQINTNMNWNYKLSADIDFDAVSPAYVSINGNTGNYTSTVKFKGKIDGNEHIISNLNKFTNLSYPYVIYYLDSGAEVRNLFVDNLTLTSNEEMTNSNYCGFIGYVAAQAVVDNVRIANSTLGANADAGFIAGHNSGTVQNCSVVDSKIYDVDTGRTLILGGIVGYNSSVVRYCYTRNLKIEVLDTVVVSSVGGITGFNSSTIFSCYSNGTIKANVSYVGGLNGKATSANFHTTYNNISYVNVYQSAGDYASAIEAYAHSLSYTIRCVALGNVSGTGPHTNRISGDQTSSVTNFAYAGQNVTGIADGTKGNATQLLTAEELATPEVWQDIVQLGDAWDYHAVSRGSIPLLVNDAKREGWKQQDIFLPGQSDDPTLEVISAVYNGSATLRYSMTAKLYHPGFKTEDIIDTLVVKFDGMGISEAKQRLGEAVFEITPAQNEDATNIVINNKDFEKAIDGYELTVSYTQPTPSRSRELSALVKYVNLDGSEHINYWEIPDISTWNTLAGTHGTEGENFKLTGMVDFNHSNAENNCRCLVFARLEGAGTDSSGNPTCGFKNLSFVSDVNGNPWIENVTSGLTNVRFEDMSFDFSNTRADSVRLMTGAILNVSGADNIYIDGLTLYCNRYSRAKFGFISTAGGIISNVTINNASCSEAENGSGTRQDYASAFVAYSTFGFNNLRGTNIKVDVPMNNKVGALVGGGADYGTLCTNVYLHGFTVKGYDYVAGIQGHGALGFNNIDIGGYDDKNSYVYAKNSNAGSVAGYTTTTNSVANSQNYFVDSVDVETSTTGIAGIVFGNGLHTYIQLGIISNSSVKGAEVGGIAGYLNGSITYNDVQLINCTITGLRTNGTTANSGAGGIAGVTSQSSNAEYFRGIVLRNCNISGMSNVGGLFGSISRTTMSSAVVERVYIAEDVTISASEKNVGGIAGYSKYLNLTDSICGAKVICDGEVAGGIVGLSDPDTITSSSDKPWVTMTRTVFVGTVKASDYAGGLIGKLNSSSAQYTTDFANNCLVVANVTSAGQKLSLWINNTHSVRDAGVGSVYVYEGSLLNGQSARAIKESAEQLGYTAPSLTPQLRDSKDQAVNLFVDDELLNTPTFYTSTLGFGASYWKTSHIGTDGNIYMPFTVSYLLPQGSKVPTPLTYAMYAADGVTPAGIQIPIAGLGRQTVVYTTGINTVNVEVADDKSSVRINNVDYNIPQSSHVISLYYDFVTDLTVDSITYHASDLARKVMTFTHSNGDSEWYYVDKDGVIHYGSAQVTATMTEAGTITLPNKAVHLSHGYAMDDHGNVYSLPDATADATMSVNASQHANLSNAPLTPLYDNGGLQVYYYYTLRAADGLKVFDRVFIFNDKPIYVTYLQDVVYDGIVAGRRNISGNIKSYLALLGNDGTLTSYQNTMLQSAIINNGICYVSNNFAYNGTVLLAYYADGSVIGIDYSTGAVVCNYDANPKPVTLANFFASTLTSLFNTSDENKTIKSVNDYTDSQQLVTSLTNSGELSQMLTQSGADGNGTEADGEGKALAEMLGDTAIVYSPYTKQYEVVATSSLNSVNPISITKKTLEDRKQIVTELQEERPNALQNMLNNIATFAEEEPAGFVSIAALSLVALTALVIIYIKVIRKRRNSR